jgi:hypothetical protein
MSERDDITPDVHATATLLPWYLAGKLQEEERRAVREHLAICPACQREFEELTWLRGAVQAAYRETPVPVASDVFERVMARIDTESEVSPEETGSRQRPMPVRTDLQPAGPLTAFLNGLRGLFSLQWVPVLATGLLVTQLAAIMWLLAMRDAGPQDGRMRGGPPGENRVMERSVPSPTSRIQVVFQPDTSVRDMGRILKEIHGRIVDGPSPAGGYAIDVPAAGSAEVSKLLQDLQSQTSVIRSAESMMP